MGKRHSKLRKVVPLVLGLAVGSAGAVSAQEAVDDSVFNTPTGDFVFVTDYMHNINRNEKTNLNELIKGGNITRIYALNPDEAIKSRINFLNSARGKEFYGGRKDEERLKLIGRYQNFLSELTKQKVSPSAKSLESLSAAVMDGETTPEELKNVEDSVYVIVKEGIDKKEGKYSVFYLTRLVSDKTPSQYKSEIEKLQKDYSDLENNYKALIQKEKPKKEKDYRSIYLQAQQTASADLTSYITSLGARFNPFQKVDIGFGANLDIGFGLDKETDSYSALLSAGRTANGTMTDTGKFSIGGSLEAQFGPLLIGGGFDYKNWIQNVVEQILDSSGNVVKSNTNSIPNRQIFGKVYTGVELPIGDAMRLGMVAGYNMKDGGYFGFRVGLKVK